jgi:hypothetical protein
MYCTAHCLWVSKFVRITSFFLFKSNKGCPVRCIPESTANSMPIFEPVYNVAIQNTYCTMQLYTTCPGKENSCARISKLFRSAGIDSEGSILLASVAGVDHNLTLCPLHGQPHARVEHNPIRESTISLSQGLWIWPLRVSERSYVVFVLLILGGWHIYVET